MDLAYFSTMLAVPELPSAYVRLKMAASPVTPASSFFLTSMPVTLEFRSLPTHAAETSSRFLG